MQLRIALATTTLLISPTLAAQPSPVFCELYAREIMRMDLSTTSNPDELLALPDLLLDWKRQIQKACMVKDQEPLLPGLKMGNEASWLESLLVIQTTREKVVEAQQTASRLKDTPELLQETVIPIKPPPIKTVDPSPKDPPSDPSHVKTDAESKYTAERPCNRQELSGFDPGTPEQAKWCKQNYASYDEKSGTVLCRADLKRSPCAR